MFRLPIPLVIVGLLLAGCSFLDQGDLAIDQNTIVLDGNSVGVLTVRNTGGGNIAWSLSNSDGWWFAEPTNGTLGPLEATNIMLLVDRSRSVNQSRPMERQPGVYVATVPVSSDFGNAYATLQVIVNEEPTNDRCAARAAATTTGSATFSTTDDPLAAWREPWADTPAAPTHVLVRYRDRSIDVPYLLEGSGQPVANQVAEAFGLSERRTGPGRGVELARIPEGVDPEAFVADLDRDHRVLYAELDRPLFLQQTFPNDPGLPRQWGPCRFGLPLAWDVWTGAELGGEDAPKSTIAVIDSGVDIDHPDLAARMLPGYDFCPLATARSAEDCTGAIPEPGGAAGTDAHGTHVAGIAAAVGDNRSGIAGVSYFGTRILPVKVFDDAGSVTSVAVVACSIYWATGSTDPSEICGAAPNPHPARILNLSLGGPIPPSPTLNAAVRAATDRGALVFAASGNGSGANAYRGIYAPANAPDALAVGSVNSNFERSSFSQFDAMGGRSVDLMAPGGFQLANGATIYSTVLDDTYGFLAGTSMATPYVSGVAALMWSHEPRLEASEVIQRLRSTAYASPSWNASEYGAGVVCADRALGLSSRCGMD